MIFKTGIVENREMVIPNGEISDVYYDEEASRWVISMEESNHTLSKEFDKVGPLRKTLIN